MIVLFYVLKFSNMFRSIFDHPQGDNFSFFIFSNWGKERKKYLHEDGKNWPKHVGEF